MYPHTQKRETDSKSGALITAALDRMERSRGWLSKKINVSNGYLYLIVKGRVNPSYTVVASIAEAIEINKDLLWNSIQEEWREKLNGLDNG